MMTMTIQKFGDIGSQGLLFMFLKLRYNAEITDVTNIALVFGLMMMINQLGLVPLLSGKFQFRDTSILIIGMSTSIIGCIILAIRDNLNTILLSCLFGYQFHWKISHDQGMKKVEESIEPENKSYEHV